IEHRRRRGCRPLKRATVPGISRRIAQLLASYKTHRKLNDLTDHAANEDQYADDGNHDPGTPFCYVVVLKAAGHAKNSDDVHRYECDVKPRQRKPEGRLAPAFVQPESERFRPPIPNCGEKRENNAPDNHVMKMRDQEHAVV